MKLVPAQLVDEGAKHRHEETAVEGGHHHGGERPHEGDGIE